METQLEIVFEGMDTSDAVRTRVEKEVQKLERVFDRITACRVVVEAPGHGKHKGGLFNCRIHMLLPGGAEVAVNRNHSRDHAHEDVYVAVRDSFNAAKRQLQDVVRKMEGKVKTHTAPPYGRVAKIFHEQGYGFIEAPDGSEIYFDKSAVVDGDFEKLDVGQQVTYVTAPGEKGVHASTVHVSS